MSFLSKAKALLLAAFSVFKTAPDEFTPTGFMKNVTVSARPAKNAPEPKDTNRTARKLHGIPHGVPGAKLARKALKGSVGNHGLVN